MEKESFVSNIWKSLLDRFRNGRRLDLGKEDDPLIRFHKIALALLFFVLMLSICACAGDPSLSALTPAGPVAETQLWLIKLSLAIMVFVTLVVVILYTYVLFRFRDRPGDTHIPEQVEGSRKLELTYTIIPIILLIILAVPTITTTFQLGEGYPADDFTAMEVEETAALRVNIVGKMYWWEFEYRDLDIFTAQELYIPIGEKIYFELTSDDVIHSFWVPPLGGKADTIPGQINALWLQADKPGVYEGRCANFCGESHALMNFRVIALERDEFDQWVQDMQTFTAEADLDPEADPNGQPGVELAQQGRTVFQQKCISCHSVAADIHNPNGPSMVGFASRSLLASYLENNPEDLAAWIENPLAVKPAVLMPSAEELGLTIEDIDALVEYLGTLQLDGTYNPLLKDGGQPYK